MATRVLGPTGSPRRRRLGLFVAPAVIVALLVAVGAAAGPVSNTAQFEGDDGNLNINSSTFMDWNGFAPTTWNGTAPRRDAHTGASAATKGWSFDGIEDDQNSGTDNVFGGGVKQDNDCASVSTGPKPPNKDDLKRIYVAQKQVGNDHYLGLAWVRIAQNSTTASAHVAFEFNQGDNGLCAASDLVRRTVNDMLIVYDFAGGTSLPILKLLRWKTSASDPGAICEQTGKAATAAGCWVLQNANLNLSGHAEARVNTAGSAEDAIGPTSPETLGTVEFGEAIINLTGAGVFPAANLPVQSCLTFGNIYAVSRSSGNSGTAQMKDLVGPAVADVTNCGSIIVKKVDQDGAPLAGAQFTVTPGQTTGTTTAASSVMSPVAGRPGLFCIDRLLIRPTPYTVSETVTPSGYEPAADQQFVVTTASTCAGRIAEATGDGPAPDLTFVNVFIPLETFITTQASSGTIGDAIFDTAELTGAAGPGTITFKVYGPRPLDSTQASCEAGNLQGTFVVQVSGNGTYRSDANGPFVPTQAGLYDWTADYAATSGTVLPSSSPCGAANETSTVAKATPQLTTDAGPAVFLGANGADLFDRATLTGAHNPTGSITFRLYRGADCSPGNLVATVGIAGGAPVTANGSYDSATVHVTLAGQYRWIANYSGDANNEATANGCNEANENVKVLNPGIAITKTADVTRIHSGDSVTYTIKVENTGDDDLVNVTVTDNLFPAACNKVIGNLAAGASHTYTCTVAVTGQPGDTITNTATVVGDVPGDGTVEDSDEAAVDIIDPSIEITKALADGQPATVTVGSSVTYKITITNTGDSPLSNIVVTDALVSACNKDDIPDLAPGASFSYECTLLDVQMGFATNVAVVEAEDELGGPVEDEDDETITVEKAKPTVTTEASDTIVIGQGSISDTATLAGGYQPTGTITFQLYGPNDATCSGPNLYTGDPVQVSGNGVYTSAGFQPTAAGTYRWIANYSGDGNNEPTTNGCNEANESVEVERAPSRTDTAQSFIPQDTATISGFGTPTGSVTFKLYKAPTDCTGPALFEQTVPLAGGTATTTNTGTGPDGYTATGEGDWYWQVTYTGDGNNLPSTSACGVERFTIDNTHGTP